ncbi:MAG: CHAT domain-containing protein, partial [Parafilimonas sp.]
MKRLIRFLFLSILSLIVFNISFCQVKNGEDLFAKISDLDYKSSKPDSDKLVVFYKLKKEIENEKELNDSAYALVLLKISKYEFLVRNNYEISIDFANYALHAAKALKSESLRYIQVNCYYNLASSYQKLMLYTKALNYFDSVILLCNKNFSDTKNFQLDARLFKTYIYFSSGDYQKVIDESNAGINLSLFKRDSSYLVYFLNQKAQAFSYLNYLNQAFTNTTAAISVAKKINDQYELATSYKTLGFIYEKKNLLDSAEYFFKQSIEIRFETKDYQQIASDYIDLGNFYLNDLLDYKKASYCYNQTLKYANKIEYLPDRNLKIALAYLNLGETNSSQKKYAEASKYFLKSFDNLNIHLHNNLKNNPASIQLAKVSNKDLVIVLLNDKTNLLLQLYKVNADTSYLYASIKSALVSDSVITQIRHEQLGEESKLYWRNKTRDLYTNAIEACYLANKVNLAFFFIEKSRAVLLNDKLNELGASSYLSAADAAKQDDYQIKIVELEQKLSTLAENSNQFKQVQIQLLDVKDQFEQYIKTLDIKYPAYYQDKYEDAVPSLQNLQQYLAKNNQNFIHYFLGDTVTYILAVKATNTKFIRLSQKEFNKESLSAFLQLCANKEKLNGNYNSFAALSNSIYKAIFQPLQLSKGSVIICSDNIVIPFDALCTDANGKSFLLNNYSFSYVYSARFLMKQFNNPVGKGNFVGFAPVSFAPYLNVADLKNAGNALQASAAYYKNDKLFVHENASRKNFFDYASSYSIVGIFSHAKADTTDNEPVLFMQDSLIHLSELQLLDNPATKLVLLSACQTNVGKFATGEGIYSLARGFSSAGIPSVAATLWKADEQAIYSISEKFNQYLSEGMNKDEALQKAKLFFIQSNSNNEKLLPYYWANMILIGNTDAIDLTTKSINYWLIITGACILIIVFIFFY